jgi:alpha-L-fucosidase 2
VTVGLQDNVRTSPASNISCDADGAHLRGQTQEDIGLIFDARVRAVAGSPEALCTSSGSMVFPSNGFSQTVTLVFTAGTNFDQRNGNVASNYSFRGADPEMTVLSTVQAASKKSYPDLYNSHVQDYTNLFDQFILNLPDTNNSANVPTAQLMEEYTYTTDVGNPFVESLLFDYGRYLFIASSRPGSLPPNLQGIWTEQLSPAWSADYHVDINLEM